MDTMNTFTTPPGLPSAPSPGGLRIGYARVCTDAQDLTAQRDALAALGSRPSGSPPATA